MDSGEGRMGSPFNPLDKMPLRWASQPNFALRVGGSHTSLLFFLQTSFIQQPRTISTGLGAPSCWDAVTGKSRAVCVLTLRPA